MKIAYLVVRTDHASVYYRTIQFLPILANLGMETAVIPIPKTFYKRISLFKTLRDFDVVVLQRKLFNWVNFAPLRYYARKLIFDLDDALFIKDSKSPSSESFTRKVRFNRTARSCDHVVCGNQFVLDHAIQVQPKASIIPTLVDTELYQKTPPPEKTNPFTAVWIGGRSTLFYLENILPVLESLTTQIKGFKLRVISDLFPKSDTLPIETIPWSRETEIQAIKGGDVGLMPLRDDDWSKGKCGLKLLQYAAAGLPMVCSPYGVNQEIVVEDQSGFHAHDPKAWARALIALAKAPELRARMGVTAQDIVKKKFSLFAYKTAYTDLLKSVAASESIKNH